VTFVLVFGGTFDPVHNGHLAIARQARAATGAKTVWFVPAALPPLRGPPLATAEDRYDLLVAATQDEPGFAVFDMAIRRGGVSYTVETMEALHSEHPDLDLALLLGADAARTIPAWERAEDLLRRERFVVVNRAGAPPPITSTELEELGFSTARTQLVRVESPDISASEVRRRSGTGAPLAGLVPRAVEALIEAKRLYRSNPDDA
jgi:nicotinate-nucleotide adenylyltransferase